VADLIEPLSNRTGEGHILTEEMGVRLSPYLRVYLRHFGQYVLDRDDQPPPLQPKPLLISP
jgi:hypothetical protein